MTGYTVHTGATEKFVAGWDQVFGVQSTAKKKSTAKKAQKKAPKKASKKKRAKKRMRKKSGR